MATIAEGGLFPPIIQAYEPATLITDFGTNGLTVNFNVSEYTSLADVKSIHISVTRQSNYETIFNTVYYPLGIYVLNYEPQDYDCSITIPFSSIVFNLGQINYNEYYKVQVRLSKDDSYNDELGQDLSAYLTNESNLIQFSEWSTVCLYRFIAPPTINIDGNGSPLSAISNNNQITSSNLIISGNYTKDVIITPPIAGSDLADGTKDLEYLTSYRIKLYDNLNNNELVFDSGDLTVDRNHPTSFYYNLPYYFENSDNVTLRFSYITCNLYESYIDYNITVAYSHSNWRDQSYINEITSVDTVIGKVNITLEPQDSSVPIPQGSIITVRRGCDQDNFTIWDTIYSKTLTAAISTPISIDDFTIESGNIYKYEINFTYNNVTYFIVEGPVMSVFDDAFLTGQGTQLCVKFNPNITSFKRNVADNILTTLGSQYPFITRNGNMDYRSFSLSGTIAYEMDNEHQFSSRSAIYGEWINVYGSYFVNHYFNQQNDRITQRKFRELVMDYLYNDSPKLFRSTPEGNVLVRITDVNLTPNQQLGRMIYDFSCTVTEIGEASIDNCKLYNIQDFGD